MSKTFGEYVSKRGACRSQAADAIDATGADGAAGATGVTGAVACNFAVAKSVEEERLVFGWASVVEREDGETVVDWQDDLLEIGELERAAYDFVEFYREGSEMHERGGLEVAVLVESMVFTQGKMETLGLAKGALPQGWWVGFRVMDDGVWRKVKDGTYRMFSIEGQAVREQI